MAEDAQIALRKRAARAFAASSAETLALALTSWPTSLDITYVRAPESGLVMLQGRMGGSGDRFHLGEATVTRASVSFTESADAGADAPGTPAILGTSYVLGNDPHHAGAAAVFDALLQSEAHRDRVIRDVIEPLEATLLARDRARRVAAERTVVDFFTVAREHGDETDDEDDA